MLSLLVACSFHCLAGKHILRNSKKSAVLIKDLAAITVQMFYKLAVDICILMSTASLLSFNTLAGFNSAFGRTRLPAPLSITPKYEQMEVVGW